MERHQEVEAAVTDLIRELGKQVGETFSMYEIGVPLGDKGYGHDELASAVDKLIRDKVAEVVPGTNSLRLLMAL